MRTIAQFLHEHPFFADFDPAMIELLAGCATNVHYREGETLFTEGGPADAFYVIRTGRVAIQVHLPAGGALVLDTVDAGDVVGWSWLVPPYRWAFDAHACLPTSATAFDAACLRAKCEADPAAGYLFMRRVNQIMMHRLEAARIRLLDLYGGTSP